MDIYIFYKNANYNDITFNLAFNNDSENNENNNIDDDNSSNNNSGSKGRHDCIVKVSEVGRPVPNCNVPVGTVLYMYMQVIPS